MSPVLVVLAAMDGALTIIERGSAWLAAYRKQVGELTPEEDAAQEQFEERRFRAWQSGTPV
jgi:hypothetical protein